MTVRSAITGKIYDPDNVWYIANIQQIAAYNSNGADGEVLDILYNGRMNRFIFVYPKNEFMDLLYAKWSEHELQLENKDNGVNLNDKKEIQDYTHKI